MPARSRTACAVILCRNAATVRPNTGVPSIEGLHEPDRTYFDDSIQCVHSDLRNPQAKGQNPIVCPQNFDSGAGRALMLTNNGAFDAPLAEPPDDQSEHDADRRPDQKVAVHNRGRMLPALADEIAES